MPIGNADLPAVPASLPETRRWLRGLLGREHPALTDVELLATELVTNSIRHTDSPTVNVAVAMVDDARLRVDITDAGHPTSRPHRTASPNGSAESGRGLHLVEAIADSFGCATGEAGQTVWFEIAY